MLHPSDCSGSVDGRIPRVILLFYHAVCRHPSSPLSRSTTVTFGRYVWYSNLYVENNDVILSSLDNLNSRVGFCPGWCGQGQ
jgi:hypothetical protein